jgi:hypothetical protein
MSRAEERQPAAFSQAEQTEQRERDLPASTAGSGLDGHLDLQGWPLGWMLTHRKKGTPISQAQGKANGVPFSAEG